MGGGEGPSGDYSAGSGRFMYWGDAPSPFGYQYQYPIQYTYPQQSQQPKIMTVNPQLETALPNWVIPATILGAIAIIGIAIIARR